MTTVLTRRALEKFDLNNKDHIQLYRDFLISSKWTNGCPFALEYPWANVPDMIKDKLVKFYLKVEE